MIKQFSYDLSHLIHKKLNVPSVFNYMPYLKHVTFEALNKAYLQGRRDQTDTVVPKRRYFRSAKSKPE